MIRKKAIQIVSEFASNEIIVSANGFISRDLFESLDKKSNFYMIGSMGLASSIGLGIALKNPKKLVFVFDGDGNILMNLGSLVTIGSKKPKNLIHVIFDNNAHESTGGQPTHSNEIKLEKMAKAAKYNVLTTKTASKLKIILKKMVKNSGPICLVIKVSKSKEKSKRVKWEPKEIRDRFMSTIK